MKFNKWKSRRFWFASWAAFLATLVIVVCLTKGASVGDWTSIITLLVGTVPVFIVSETTSKSILSSKSSKTVEDNSSKGD